MALCLNYQGRIQRFGKRRGALCSPLWLDDEKELGFRWFKKTKTTLETKSFWRNISSSIFKFSRDLHILKASEEKKERKKRGS